MCGAEHHPEKVKSNRFEKQHHNKSCYIQKTFLESQLQATSDLSFYANRWVSRFHGKPLPLQEKGEATSNGNRSQDALLLTNHKENIGSPSKWHEYKIDVVIDSCQLVILGAIDWFLWCSFFLWVCQKHSSFQSAHMFTSSFLRINGETHEQLISSVRNFRKFPAGSSAASEPTSGDTPGKAWPRARGGHGLVEHHFFSGFLRVTPLTSRETREKKHDFVLDSVVFFRKHPKSGSCGAYFHQVKMAGNSLGLPTQTSPKGRSDFGLSRQSWRTWLRRSIIIIINPWGARNMDKNTNHYVNSVNIYMTFSRCFYKHHLVLQCFAPVENRGSFRKSSAQSLQLRVFDLMLLSGWAAFREDQLPEGQALASLPVAGMQMDLLYISLSGCGSGHGQDWDWPELKKKKKKKHFWQVMSLPSSVRDEPSVLSSEFVFLGAFCFLLFTSVGSDSDQENIRKQPKQNPESNWILGLSHPFCQVFLSSSWPRFGSSSFAWYLDAPAPVSRISRS